MIGGRSPQGERGLKSAYRRPPEGEEGRSPQGERGLKSLVWSLVANRSMSLSARRAWIEIWSLSVWQATGCPSLSARRAWIEIDFPNHAATHIVVALRKESVD